MRGVLISVAALTLSACGSQGGSQPAPSADATAAGPQTYFTTEIAPILMTNCATCHQTGAESGNISLLPANAIAMTVNVAAIEAPKMMRIVPGMPDESYLIMKLEGTHVPHGGSGSQMPFGAPPLSPDKIAKFRTWITDGAKP